MGKNKKRRAPVPTPPAPAPVSPAAAPTPVAAGTYMGFLWLAILLLGLLTLAAYFNSFHAGLVLDNSVLIGDDPRIRAWNSNNLHAIFTRNYWWPMFESDLYRPLTTLTYLINYAVLNEGQNVLGYHLVNFFLHWANVAMVFVIMRRLAGRLELAVLTAAIFAVHPVNIESVTNIIGRADLLATLSILLGGWCYMKAAASSGVKKIAWLAGLGLNALWGVFAKESAVMVCVYVFLYDLVWRWPQLPGRTFAERLQKAAWQFGAQGYSALTPALVALWIVRHQLFADSPVFGQIFVDNPVSHSWMPLTKPMGFIPAPWFPGFMTALKVIGRYLGLLVYPQTLSSEYSYNQIPLYGDSGSAGENVLAWISLAVVGLLIGLAIRLRRTHPLFTWGVGVFFTMQLLTANLLFPIGTIMGERFLYLPSVGFAVVAALALWHIGTALARQLRARPNLAWVLPALFILVLAARTSARNRDWQDSLSLWSSAARASPNSFKSYKGYANSLWDQGREKYPNDPIQQEHALDTSIPIAETALSILDHPPLPIEKEDNTIYQDLGMFYRLKGNFLLQRNQPDEAKNFFQKSVAVLQRAVRVDHWVNQTSRESSRRRGRPESEIADVGNYHIYVQLELSYECLEDWANAQACARYIARLVPTQGFAYRMAASTAFRQGKVTETAIYFLEAGLLDNSDDAAWRGLAACYQFMGLPPTTLRIDGNNHFLDTSIPLVNDQVNKAAVALVQQFLDSKQYDGARDYRDKFVRDLKMSADLFPKF